MTNIVHEHVYRPVEKSDQHGNQIFFCETCGKETTFMKKGKWIKLAQYNAKCPKCEASLGANHLDDLVAGAYDHFVEVHCVGGSFD